MARRKRTTTQDKADIRKRAKEQRRYERDVQFTLQKLNADKLVRIEGIPDADWQQAVDSEPIEEAKPLPDPPDFITQLIERREWRPVVDALSDVGRLVHLAGRMDGVDEEAIRVELLRVRRDAYESELTIQAGRVGCLGMQARLTSGPSLSALNEMSKDDATSIVNTYNYDLAVKVAQIRQETPTANRYTYRKRLEEYIEQRTANKTPVVTQYAASTARSLAQQDFYAFNSALMGTAHLEPLEAVCPVCQGWVNRGEVPLPVALNNPGPYHARCPHGWVTSSQRVAQAECPSLWMGQ